MIVPVLRVNPAIAESIHNSSPAVAGIDRQDLVHRLRARDAAAFDQWVGEESPGVHRLVSRLLGWHHDCEDVVQDVFVAAWKKIGKFRGDSEIRTWLYAIAINQCRRHRRRYLQHKSRFQTLKGETPDMQSDANNDATPDVRQIQTAINGLSHRDREVIVLCGIQQTPVEQVASMLGLRKNIVEVRLHRARQRLKQKLQQTTGDRPDVHAAIGDDS